MKKQFILFLFLIIALDNLFAQKWELVKHFDTPVNKLVIDNKGGFYVGTSTLYYSQDLFSWNILNLKNLSYKDFIVYNDTLIASTTNDSLVINSKKYSLPGSYYLYKSENTVLTSTGYIYSVRPEFSTLNLDSIKKTIIDGTYIKYKFPLNTEVVKDSLLYTGFSNYYGACVYNLNTKQWRTLDKIKNEVVNYVDVVDNRYYAIIGKGVDHIFLSEDRGVTGVIKTLPSFLFGSWSNSGVRIMDKTILLYYNNSPNKSGLIRSKDYGDTWDTLSLDTTFTDLKFKNDTLYALTTKNNLIKMSLSNSIISDLTLSSHTVNIGNAQNSTATISINSTTDWTASSNQSWLAVSPNITTTGNGIVTFTADMNPSIVSRTATITVSALNAPAQIITITQAAGDTIVSVSSKVSNIGSVANSTVSLDITSNTTWTTSIKQTWLSVNPSTSVTGNSLITFTALANPTTEIRTAIIIVSALGASDTISITQVAGDTALVLSKKIISFTDKASTDSVLITSNTPWTASSDVSWLTLSPESGSGNDTLIITAQANTTTSIRTATITIMSTSSASLKSVTEQTIMVTQAAGNGTAVIDVNTNKLMIYPNPAKTNFSINSKENSIIEVYSINGELVLTKQVIKNELISTNNLPTGLYFVKIINCNSITIRSLIIDKK